MRRIIYKSSPIQLIKAVIIAEVLVGAIVAALSFIFDLEQLYLRLPFSEIVSSDIYAMIVLIIVQILIIIWIFVTWYIETYTVFPTRVEHMSGTFLREQTVASLKNYSRISIKYGILNRWFNYGTVEILDQTGAVLASIPNVVQVDSETKKIERLLGSSKNRIDEPSAALESLLAQGEGNALEFKSYFRWDIGKKSVNKDLEIAIMKSISGFMNSKGGTLILGVDDKGEVHGLEKDILTIKKKNIDGLENHITTVINNTLGAEYSNYYQIRFELCYDSVVCVVEVQECNQPVFMKIDGTEKFFLRTGNSTRELNVREAYKYIRSKYESFRG